MHQESYVKYIATRDGVEKIQSSHGKEPATPRQIKLIEKMMNDFPDYKLTFEYEDYLNDPDRENASELISAILNENIETVTTKENYVSYIAKRPRVERLGEHGLFSDEGIEINLEDVAKDVGQHQGNVWTHIISLKREDAERLGYDHADSWMNLCRAKRNELAEAMKIRPDDLIWYAAFHNEGHHPHIHMIAYSKNDKQGYVSKEGIAKIRKMFAGEIFHQDLINIYEGQTRVRNEIKQFSKDIVMNCLDEIQKISIGQNRKIIENIVALKQLLNDYHGRAMYAYIPKDAKRLIDEIVIEIEKEKNIKTLYQQWCEYKHDIHQTYNDHQQIVKPLHEQKEFKSIKNMILHEVLDHDINKVTYDEQMDEVSQKDESECMYDESELSEEIMESTLSESALNYKIEWNDRYKEAVQYFYGSVDTEQDIETAETLLQEECNDKNILAFELLAKLKEIAGEDVANSLYQEAICGAKVILNNNDNKFIQSYLSYKVGKYHFYGKGTEQNYEEAYRYFLKSDNEYAWYSLGTMYQRGLYVERSDKEAFDYYLKSANKGNPFACYQVGDFYDRGVAVMQDKTKADQYYKIAYTKFEDMASDKEDDHLLYRLGEMNYHGKGIDKNLDKAKSYLEKAIGFDNENAKYLLAKVYLETYDYPNIPQAIEWLEASKHPNAAYLLGKVYHDGILVEKDTSKAIKYFTICAEEHQNPAAMYKLAKIYLNEIAYQDTQKALQYLILASDMGHAYAQLKLGDIYLKGEVVTRNVDQAIIYLERSAQQNNMFAQYILGKLFLFGKDVDKDTEKAIMYLTLAAEQGNEYAAYLLEQRNDYDQQPLVLLTSRLFHHVSKIFQNELPHETNLLGHVDKKLARKLRQKKIAQGHSEKEHDINIR